MAKRFASFYRSWAVVMKQYIRVYKQLFSMNLSVLTAHRAAFINSIVGGTIWGVFSFIVMILLTYNVKEIFTWTKQDILILSGILGIILGIFNVLFQGSFDSFPNLVNKGKLDAFLLKPIDAQFLTSTYSIRVISGSRALVGFIFLIYLSQAYHFSFSIGGILVSIPLIIIGLALYYAIWAIITTLTIWFTRADNIVEMLHNLQGIMRLPPVVFREVNIIVFLFVLPLVIIASAPVGLVLGRANISGILLLVVLAGIFVFLSRKFWLFALRSYTSASS